VLPETVHTAAVSDVTVTLKLELEDGETVKVPLPKTLLPGSVKVMVWEALVIVKVPVTYVIV
jgi:hypothetical protein